MILVILENDVIISIGLFLLTNYYHSQFLNAPWLHTAIDFVIGLPSSQGITTSQLAVDWFSKSLWLIFLSALLTQFLHLTPQAHSIWYDLSISQWDTTSQSWMFLMSCTYHRCAHMLSWSSSSMTHKSLVQVLEWVLQGWMEGEWVYYLISCFDMLR